MEIQKNMILFRDLLNKENAATSRSGHRKLKQNEKEIISCKRKAATSLLIKQYLGSLGTNNHDSSRIDARNLQKQVIRNTPHVCNIFNVHTNYEGKSASTPSYPQRNSNSDRRKHETANFDKTTYCRPATNLYKEQVICKTIDKRKVLKLVKMLAEAHRTEKQKNAWDVYITKLKIKHNLLESETQSAKTTETLKQNQLTNKLYEDAHRNVSKANQSIDCEDLNEFCNIDTTAIDPSHVSHQNMNQHSLSSETRQNPYPKQLPIKSKEQVSLKAKSHFCCSTQSKERLRKLDAVNSRNLDAPNRRSNRFEKRNIFCKAMCNRSCSPRYRREALETDISLSDSLTNERKKNGSKNKITATRSKLKSSTIKSERKLESSDTTFTNSGEKMQNKCIKTPVFEQMSQPAAVGKTRQDKEKQIRHRKKRADFLRPELRKTLHTSVSARKTESSDATGPESGGTNQCESVETTRCESLQNSGPGSVEKIRTRSSGITHQYKEKCYERNLNRRFDNKRSELERKVRTHKIESSDTMGFESGEKMRYEFMKRRQREPQHISSPQFSKITRQNEEKRDHNEKRETGHKRLGEKKEKRTRKPNSSDTRVLNEDENYHNIIISAVDYTRSELEGEIQMQKTAVIPKKRTHDGVPVKFEYDRDENVYNKDWLSKEEKEDEEEKLIRCKRRIRKLLDQAYRGLVEKIQYCKDSSSEEEKEIIICCRIPKSLQNILQESLKESTDTLRSNFSCEMRQDTKRSARQDLSEKLRSQSAENTLTKSAASPRTESLERLRLKQRVPEYMAKDIGRQHKHYISKENNKLIYCVDSLQNNSSNAFWMQMKANTDDVANRESVFTLLSEVEQTDDKNLNIEEILIEELNKSNKAKRDIDEMLGGEPSHRQCHDVLFFDLPTRDCCTEVTDSLSKANECPKNNRELLTIAVNTDPLGFLALFELSREAAGRLLAYARLTCSKILPIPRSIALRLPVLSYRFNIRGTGVGPQLASIDEWRRQCADQQCSTPFTGSPNHRNCCVCRHLLERKNKSPVGIFPCQYCGKGFIRAYCRELHEQNCSKNQGHKHDIPINLAILK